MEVGNQSFAVLYMKEVERAPTAGSLPKCTQWPAAGSQSLEPSLLFPGSHVQELGVSNPGTRFN